MIQRVKDWGEMSDEKKKDTILVFIEKAQEISGGITRRRLKNDFPTRYYEYAGNLAHDMNGSISNLYYKIRSKDLSTSTFWQNYYALLFYVNSAEVLIELLDLKGIE